MDEHVEIEQTPEEVDAAAWAKFESQLDAPSEPVGEGAAEAGEVQSDANAGIPAPVVKAEEKPEPPKIDKRTREGRKVSIQAEIDELTKQRHHEERELARIRAERAAAEKPAPVSTRPSAADVDAAPDPTDTATYPDGQFDPKFLQDRIDWGVRQGLKARDQQQAQTAEDRAWQAQGQKQLTTLREKIAAVHADVPAFLADLPDELRNLTPSGMLTPEGRKLVRTAEGADLAVRCAITDSIIESENAVALIEHLRDHPEEFQRLLTLPPDALFRHMGRLDATLGAATSRPSPKVPTVSQAKPPIKPMGTAASSADPDALSDDLPVDEFIRRGNRQERARKDRA